MFARPRIERAVSASRLTAPFARLDVEHATTLIEQRYGWHTADVRRVATERDDTFRLSSPAGDFIAKFAHPDDPVLELGDEVTVLERLEREFPELPVQRIVPGVDGRGLQRVTDTSGRERALRVLRFVEGSPLGAAARDEAALHALGRVHGRLATAIATIGSDSVAPPRGSSTPWNLLHAEVLPDVLPAVDDLFVREGAARILDEALERTVPALSALPLVLAHNDLHGDNVLVRDDPFAVLGVLDFGDLCRTPRVADVAVALSYSRGYREPGSTENPWTAARWQLAGLEAEHPLTVDERRLLPSLVLLRLAQRAVLNSAIAAATTANGTADYARRNLGRLAVDLHELAETAPESLGGPA